MARKWMPGVVLVCLTLLLLAAWAAGAAVGAQEGEPAAAQEAVGSAFTYQGQLREGAAPANGTYDFRFQLYDALANGAPVGPQLDVPGVTVSDGLFDVALDFGSAAFDGEARYLAVSVRPGGSGAPYTPLSPRQRLSAAPYALHAAAIADGAVTAASIGEACAYGEVLATDGQSWRCAGADVELAPAQAVSHYVQIGGVLAPAVRADFLSFRAWTEVVIFKDGAGGVHKLNGDDMVDQLYVYCPNLCPTLNNWYQQVRAGTVNRNTMDVVLGDGTGSEIMRWYFTECWPSALQNQLNDSGTAIYPRFEMACETMQLVYP